MLSIIADMMMTATRQKSDPRLPDRVNPYADRFVSDPERQRATRARQWNPYSYFQ